jgi:hypothetical protein
MYSQATIDDLIKRVGWVNPIDSSFTYVLEPRNIESTSGRDFQFYHGYITLKNIKAILPNRNETELELNQFLYDLRVQSVLTALYLVIDKDPNYDPSFNHDLYINDRLPLFDEVVGLVHAQKVLSLLNNSISSNRIERITAENIAFGLSTIKEQLEGAISAANPPFDKQIIVIGTKIW